MRRAALPVLTALCTAALLVAVQLAAASGRDTQPRFGLDLTLSTPVAAAGETVTAVVRLTMAETRPGDKVTVAGRITGGLRPVGGDPSRGTFDLPSSVWTVPTAPGLRTAVLLWRLQAVQPTPGGVEQVRVAVTSPRTRTRDEADPCGSAAASPAVSPSAARASGSGAAGGRAGVVPGAAGDGKKAAGTQGGPLRAHGLATSVAPAASPSGGRAPKDCASSSAKPGGDAAVASPEAATAGAATVLPTTARPAATAPAGGSGTPSTIAEPSTATGPAPTTRPDGPGTSGTPATSPSATRGASPTATPPAASPTPPPPPPPTAAEVAVPADQQCADDATAACAGLRFGDPRLRLARTADTTDTRPGQQVTHTVTVTDSGEAAALFATVRNSIPAGAPLVSGRISQGTYDALTGIWQTGRIAAGGTATLTLTLHVPDPAAGTVMSARSEFLGSADPAPVIEHTCPDDPGSACAITRVTAP
ncbi:hypothetical protein GCM10023205_51240 [Yinghuangia aomiensis]|uniref:DUF11 domain-containing protein n=1 Tax=Yinghuangia aomiensis TaxID=676205 RepID=A0ABP9HSW0_9ACTN